MRAQYTRTLLERLPGRTKYSYDFWHLALLGTLIIAKMVSVSFMTLMKANVNPRCRI